MKRIPVPAFDRPVPELNQGFNVILMSGLPDETDLKETKRLSELVDRLHSVPGTEVERHRKEVRRLRKMLRAIVARDHYVQRCACPSCKATTEVLRWRKAKRRAETA